MWISASVFDISAENIWVQSCLSRKHEPALHHFELIDFCFARWLCSAGLECSCSKWRFKVNLQTISNMMDNNRRTRLVCIQSPAPPSLSFPPPSFHPYANLLWDNLLLRGVGGLMLPVVLSKEAFFYSFSANRKQKQTEDMMTMNPAGFYATHLGGSLGDDIVSLSLESSFSNNLSPP